MFIEVYIESEALEYDLPVSEIAEAVNKLRGMDREDFARELFKNLTLEARQSIIEVFAEVDNRA